MNMARLMEYHLYISCRYKLELRQAHVTECQMGGILENLRDWVIDSPEQRGKWSDTEGGQLCSGPVAHEIPECNNWKQTCKRDRRK